MLEIYNEVFRTEMMSGVISILMVVIMFVCQTFTEIWNEDILEPSCHQVPLLL